MSGVMPDGKYCGLVICVSGPSGVGKGTVIQRVLELRPDMAHSVSVTTRQPRQGEQEGVDYYFRTTDEFNKMLDQGEILEYDFYCDHYYGTPRRNLEELVGRGIDVLLDITVPGSLAVMRNYPEAVSLFLLPPSFSELRRRLEKRGTENADVLRRRLEKAREEMCSACLFEYMVVNDDLPATARSILAIAEAEHCRTKRLQGLEATVLAR